MIKINLLPEERPPKKKRTTFDPGDIEQYETAIFTAVIAASLLIVCGIWYYYSSTLESLKKTKRVKKDKLKELENVKKKKKKFEKTKKELEEKIKIIENLKNTQKSPVFLMDQVSRRLPDHVWVKNWQASGNTLSLQGEALAMRALSNFIESLKSSPFIKEVDFGGAQESGKYVNYNLTCQLVKKKQKNKGESK